MRKIDILDKLGQKAITADEAAEMVLKDMKLLPEIFKGVGSENKRIKNASAKILRTVSYEHPEKLYYRFDFFAGLMDGDDTILRWNAMDVIGNLASVDKGNKIDVLLPKYYELLSDKKMVTAAHAIENLGLIARYKEGYQKEITEKLSDVKQIPRNAECQNILLGKVIIAYGGYIDQVSNKDTMISLAKKELKNSRNATKKKAEAFLKKFDGSSH